LGHKAINRDFYLSKVSRKEDRLIDIFTGARRAGKTYILFSKTNNLLDGGISPTKIIYFAGEAREINKFGPRETLETYINIMKIS